MTIQEGVDLPRVRTTVEAASLRAMADLLGDPNPIHVDPEVVRRLGLGEGVINQGHLNAGLVWEMLEQWIAGLGHIRLFEVRFTSNAYAGRPLVAGGSVRRVDPVESTVTCEVWLRDDRERDILAGTAVIRLADGGQHR